MAVLVFFVCLILLIMRNWDLFISVLAWFVIFYGLGCFDVALGLADDNPWQLSMIWVYVTFIFFGFKIATGGR